MQKTIQLKITGMKCGGCVAAVQQALQRVPGVSKVEVDLSAGSAMISYDAEKPALDALLSAVKKAGFDVSSI